MIPVPYHLDYITAAATLLSLYTIGKKKWWGWVISFLNNFVYAYMNAHLHLWGLLPVNLILIFIFAKNTKEWYRDSRSPRP